MAARLVLDDLMISIDRSVRDDNAPDARKGGGVDFKTEKNNNKSKRKYPVTGGG